VPLEPRIFALSGLLVASLILLPEISGCRGVVASSVPLGGEREQIAAPVKAASAAPSGAPAPEVAALSPAEEQAAEEGEVQAASPSSPAEPAAPGAFQVKPYATGQTWTRVLDAEFEVKLGPSQSMDMRMVNRQEARFEVLAASAGSLDKLGIEYRVDTGKITVMGREQNEPQVLAGKRYVITFPQGKPDVRSAGGGTPTKKELDSVTDDAREPLAMQVALKELSGLTAKGRGDFSTAGAIALAGGEDDDTKISQAKASLQRLGSSAGERSAWLDIAYGLTSTADPDLTIELQVAGTMTVLDAPARYQTITVRGPISLRPAKGGGMEGRGTGKVTIGYKY
jgi:hypothetical protein